MHLPVRPVMDGLGFLPHSNAVHYTQHRDQYLTLIAQARLPDGYATDPGAGLVYRHTELTDVVTDRPKAAAYRITRAPHATLPEWTFDAIGWTAEAIHHRSLAPRVALARARSVADRRGRHRSG